MSPLGYYDIKGNNVTGSVRKERRPPNLAYMLIEASIPLKMLHSVFAANDVFTHQYYLPLPQSYKVPPTKTPLASTALANALAASCTTPSTTNSTPFCPPAIKLTLNGTHTHIPMTPIATRPFAQGGGRLSNVSVSATNASGGSSSSGTATNTNGSNAISDTVTNTSGSNTISGTATYASGSSPAAGKNSQDSWDLDDMMLRNPKMAAMMQSHSKSSTKSVYSYHGPLTMFDNQVCFNLVFKDPVEFYKMNNSYASGSAMFEQDNDNDRVEKICERIRFETFVEEFRQHYVGEDTPELRSFILSSTTKAITSIRASFIHAGTKARITISPDDMFSKWRSMWCCSQKKLIRGCSLWQRRTIEH